MGQHVGLRQRRAERPQALARELAGRDRARRRGRSAGAARAPASRRTRAPRGASRGSCAGRPGSVLRPWQRVHSRPAVKHTPTAQTSRYWCRCTTTRAPAPRAAASARQPNAGPRLWACTTRAPVRRTAGATSSGRRPPAQQRGRRAGTPEERRVALQQLRVLAELLAHEPEPRHRRHAPRRRGRGSGCAGTGPCGRKPRLSGQRPCSRRSSSPPADGPRYLEVALASAAPQAQAAGAEMIVVDDGSLAANAAIARRAGARYLALGEPRGLNAARNAGIAAAEGELLAFIDDDVEVHPGWLEGLLAAAHAHPDVDVFTGPIIARFEGRAARRRTCGREGPPITHTDLGAADRDVARAWGANMAIRRSALDAVGRFDPQRRCWGGDEEEWQQRLAAAGGRIRYVGAAALDHRRAPRDARPLALMRAAHARGREAREFDEHEHRAPSLARELRVLAGCVWHTLRRRCANGPVMAAHSAGRISRALEARARPPARRRARRLPLGGERDRRRAPGRAALARRPGARRARRRPAGAHLVARSPPGAPGAGALRRAAGERGDPRPGAGRAAAVALRGGRADAPAGRAREVRQPQCACSTAWTRGASTGCCCSTMTSCCRAASSAACSPSPSAAAWRLRRRRTGGARTRRGR